ncbi:MAG: hypothetical protein WC523_03720 [Patescibacteria group bacterium]
METTNQMNDGYQNISGIVINQTKKCTGKLGCGEIKSFSCFYKNKRGKYGLSSACIECVKKYHKECGIKNKDTVSEKNKLYYKENRKKILQKVKDYYKTNKDGIDTYRKEWYNKNRIEILIDRQRYYEENKDEISEYKKEYSKTHKDEINKYKRIRGKEDVNYSISCTLRKRLCSITNLDKKTGSAVIDLGCSINCLRKYFENRFYSHARTSEIMRWENRGLWHIDHTIPLSFFDLTVREELLVACNYLNLRPLWAEENLSKNNKLPTNFNDLLIEIVIGIDEIQDKMGLICKLMKRRYAIIASQSAPTISDITEMFPLAQTEQQAEIQL